MALSQKYSVELEPLMLHITDLLGRFRNEALKDTYILDAEKMKLAKKNMAVLHPLPRVNEISTKVDADPRAMYFEQVRNGRFVRMALISTLLEGLYED